MRRTLCVLTALVTCAVGVPAKAESPAGSVTLTGVPGHSGSFVIPAESDLDVMGALWGMSHDKGLVGPSLGDWTGLLVEDKGGTLLQGAFCVRVAAQGGIPVACIPVGDGPLSVHRGTYRFRVLGNGPRVLRLSVPAPQLRSSIVSTARAASAKGSVSFTGGGVWTPGWDDTVTLGGKAETLVMDGQESSGSLVAGAQTGAACVSQTTSPCAPFPYGLTTYTAQDRTILVMEGHEYPPGSLPVGEHAWIGAAAGTETGRFRFAAVLPV